MNDTILELAKNRHSVRKFSGEDIPLEDIIYSLEVARYAPSGANEQPWRFVIINDTDVKRKVREACERGEKHLYDTVKGDFREWLLSQGLSHKKPFLEEAPFLVAVLMKKSAKYAVESLYVAVGHILLALEERGLNTLVYTPTNTQYPAKVLDVPKEFKLETILPVGYSSGEVKILKKRSLKDSMFMNRWGNTT